MALICDLESFLSAAHLTRKIVTHRRRQIIFSQGEPSDAMFYIERGSIKLIVASAQGKEVIVDILGSGSFFGESSIAYADPHHFQTAIALTDVSLVKMDSKSIRFALRQASQGIYDCISSLLRRNARMQRDFANNLLYTSEKQLARALLSVSRLTQSPSVSPDITQQDWADMLGITRQRVNVLLRQFRRQGFIGDARGLKVNPSILTLAGMDQ